MTVATVCFGFWDGFVCKFVFFLFIEFSSLTEKVASLRNRVYLCFRTDICCDV
jgi:hypothetical protein